jgi:hypothetical protein
MSPPKTNYPKNKQPVFIEQELIEHARKLSLVKGASHKNIGSSSEAIRRGYKAWLLLQFPYLKNTTKNVDWNESY